MPDGFLLKSVVFKLISKEISRADHQYMNIQPPSPPITALATALKAVPGEEIEFPAGIEEPVGVENLMLGGEEGQNLKKTWKKSESIQG